MLVFNQISGKYWARVGSNLDSLLCAQQALKYVDVAQLVAQCPDKAEVGGSIPSINTSRHAVGR